MPLYHTFLPNGTYQSLLHHSNMLYKKVHAVNGDTGETGGQEYFGRSRWNIFNIFKSIILRDNGSDGVT